MEEDGWTKEDMKETLVMALTSSLDAMRHAIVPCAAAFLALDYYFGKEFSLEERRRAMEEMEKVAGMVRKMVEEARDILLPPAGLIDPRGADGSREVD